MYWTDSETVTKHLCAQNLPSEAHYEVAVQMNSSGFGQLPHRGLVAGSETIKRLTKSSPQGPYSIVLNGVNWTQLNDAHLKPQQMVLSANLRLTTVFVEGLDYAVDHQNGKVRRLAGSQISDGGTVLVWYQPYTVLNKGVDYNIDYTGGKIYTVPGGIDLSNTTLYADYALTAADGASDLVAQAVTQAEDKILARLKEGYDENSTEQGLTTGATELAVAIVCRGLAARALLDSASAAYSRARSWIQLAKEYETAAFSTLKPFLAEPFLVAGKKSGNASWEWV